MSGYYQLPGGYVAALEDDEPFPPPDHALDEPNGLIAIGGALTPQRLLQAYRQGIFPWFSAHEPVLWWNPDPRMVLFPEELHIPHALAKKLKRPQMEIRFDHAFAQVIEACATTPRPAQTGTWIVPEIIDAYCRLHTLGYAHSAEAWQAGQLVGGLYGVAIGGMFYGESMFHHVADASKIAFVHLVRHLQSRGYGLIDCQMKTHHLQRFGAREIPRTALLAHLTRLIDQPITFST